MTSTQPTPSWILRHHAPSAVHTVAFYEPHGKARRRDGHWLIAGDSQGRVSLTNLDDYRQRVFWKAHEEALLGVGCWRGNIVTHARDNTLKIWALPDSDASRELSTASSSRDAISALPSRIQSDLPKPTLLKTLDVNALNFCAFSLLDVTEGEGEALVAVPHTLEAAWIDIYHIPSGKRLYAAIGKPDIQGAAGKRPGIAMSLHLFRLASSGDLALLAGYEDGRVALWRLHGGAWTSVWDAREHTEAVMATATARSLRALSVSADANVVRWDLSQEPHPLRQKTKHVGAASCALRGSDARVAAIGGWDGKIRLFDLAPSPTDDAFKPLGVLAYHKESVQALAFSLPKRETPAAVAEETTSDDDDSSDDDEDDAQTWLAAGGKDGRISLWQIPF